MTVLPAHAALPYRPCVGIMLFNADRQIFVGRRIDQRAEAWQMPQGGIDPGETPRRAALREMIEEIGIDRAVIVAEHPDWLRYDLPSELIGQVWNGRYRGQTQRWFAMRFTGRDQDIDIATEHAEFSAWRWAAPSALVDLAPPFKQPVYRELVTHFRRLWHITL